MSEPIFKICVALFRTHELQKDGMDIFFLWCFRKVRFRKMQFLKDGVQTVVYSFLVVLFCSLLQNDNISMPGPLDIGSNYNEYQNCYSTLEFTLLR